jgi:hypothetical protein
VISGQEELTQREVVILAAQGPLPLCVVVEKADMSAHPSFDADPRGGNLIRPPTPCALPSALVDYENFYAGQSRSHS